MKRHLWPYEQGEYRTVIAARSIVHKFLKRSSAWTYERVLIGWLFALGLASISERFNSTRKLKKKAKKSSLKTVDHHREGIYTSFKLGLSVFTEVV